MPDVVAPIATDEERAFTRLDLPAPLTEWRRAESGRVVSVGVGGAVTLTRWCGGRHDAHFTTINAAVYALATGAVRWQPAPRKIDPRHQRSNRAMGA